MSVRQAQAEIDSAEYIDWIAYSRLQNKQAAKAAKPKSRKVMTAQEMSNVWGQYAAAQQAKNPALYGK